MNDNVLHTNKIFFLAEVLDHLLQAAVQTFISLKWYSSISLISWLRACTCRLLVLLSSVLCAYVESASNNSNLLLTAYKTIST